MLIKFCVYYYKYLLNKLKESTVIDFCDERIPQESPAVYFYL